MSMPTPDDMLRNLEADLEWLINGPVQSVLVAELRACAMAGVRRAIAAEAEADRLRSVCHYLGLENSRMREDVRGIIAEECQTLGEELAEVRAERDRLQAILDQPVTMLFADGREPTRNERHLRNLLSWRMKEAEEAKAEAARLRAIIEGRE